MSQPMRGPCGHVVFPISWNNTNLVEAIEILLPVKFLWIPFSGFRGEVENVSTRGQGRHLVFRIRLKNTNLVEDVEILLPVKCHWIPFSGFREVENVSARGQGHHLVFRIRLKNTNLVEDIEILLPVKFQWIPFSGFRGEVENVSANQRPGRPSCFSDRPKKHKLGSRRWDLASCQVSMNAVQRFRGEIENDSANQRPGRPCGFYTPVFRRDVLWYSDVRPGLRPSARPSVTVFRTFLLHALRYWAEILYITLLWCT